MPQTWGETLARRVDRRIAAPVATTAAITAIVALSRHDGQLIVELAGPSLWQFSSTSAAAAGPDVLVPDAGTGRWLRAGGGAGLGGPGYKSVRAATNAALAAYTRAVNVITANANGALAAIDAITLVAGERLLLRNGAAGADNGIYEVTQVGTGATPFILTRPSDANSSAEVLPGMGVYASEGTVHGDEWFILTTNAAIVLNTTALTFTKQPSLVDLASTAAGEGASLIGIQDAAGVYTAVNVETALAEVASETTSADLSLTTRVSTEESTRTSADLSLTTRVSTEESTRTSADLSLTTRVSTEESTRASADTSLTTRVSTEESSRTSGDLSLTTRVSTEESTRTSADLSLTTRVSTEESTRTSADLSLTTRVSTEESTRASADTSLDTRLDTLDITFSLHDLREVDANGDVGNVAANGGLLASDTTPLLAADANESEYVEWAAANVDMVAVPRALPRYFTGTVNWVLRMWVSSGATDATSFTVRTSWDGGAQIIDTSAGGLASATVHEITVTIDAADIPDSADRLTMQIEPNAHATNVFQLHAFRLEGSRAN